MTTNGSKINSVRQLKKYTMQDVENATGVSKFTQMQIYNNKNYRVSSLLKILDFLELDLIVVERCEDENSVRR